MARVKPTTVTSLSGKGRGKEKRPRVLHPAQITQPPQPTLPVAKKPKRRFRPGTVALREIRQFQKSTELLVRKAPFQRLVRDISNRVSDLPVRFQSIAVEALQHSAEAFLVRLFELSNQLAIHAGRVTVMDKDMKLVHRLFDWKLPEKDSR